MRNRENGKRNRNDTEFCTSSTPKELVTYPAMPVNLNKTKTAQLYQLHEIKLTNPNHKWTLKRRRRGFARGHGVEQNVRVIHGELG